jgi:hypothetical protein
MPCGPSADQRLHPYQAYLRDAFVLLEQGRTAHQDPGVDRGRPLSTGVDPLRWHRSGMAGGDDVAHRYGNGSLLDRRVSSSKPTTVTRTVVLAPPITPLAAFRLGRNCVAVRVDAPSLLFQAMLAGSGVRCRTRAGHRVGDRPAPIWAEPASDEAEDHRCGAVRRWSGGGRTYGASRSSSAC